MELFETTQIPIIDKASKPAIIDRFHSHFIFFFIITFGLVVISGCTPGPRYGVKTGYDTHHAEVVVPKAGMVVEGMASFYGKEFGGRKTASGEMFEPDAISAAHRQWPFNTTVEVTSKTTGKSVVVRINDRGPYTDCIIDLSWGAAKQIGMTKNTPVSLKVLTVGTTP